ncbi:TRAP transporter substrate-binding protein [Konateibacter massiliensis]|uniref:TRAP transporter substrate-binding protein n=1 Tax=Konateibacter massiliensis TaxID=2002841 RepID=UPI000C15E89D
MKKNSFVIGLLALAVLMQAGCDYVGGDAKAEGVPEYVFTYAENQAEGYPTTEAAHYFSDLVYERSGGRIKIDVHSAGSLGDEVAIIEQLQYGGLDFARASIMTMGEFIPKINVLQLPYLYNDSDHMWDVLEGDIGQEFMESMEEHSLIALSWYDAGTRDFYTTQKITNLEELKGKRIRVAKSEFMEKMVAALGATPVAMDYSEVYSALELGQIDGAENNWPSYEFTEHYKVAKYMLLDEHNRIPELQLISQITWNKLSEEDRKIIKDCAEASSVYEQQLWKEQVEASKKKAVEQGTVVTTLTSQERQRFREAVIPIYEELSPEYGELIKRIIAAEK